MLAFPPKRTNHDHGKRRHRDGPWPAGGSALAVVVPNRNKEQEKSDQDWKADHDVAFDPLGNERKQSEIPKKIPIRSRIGRQYAGIRRPVQRWGPDEECGQRDRDDQPCGNNYVAPGQIWPKGLTTFLK